MTVLILTILSICWILFCLAKKRVKTLNSKKIEFRAQAIIRQMESRKKLRRRNRHKSPKH
jgi:hypothetical protein